MTTQVIQGCDVCEHDPADVHASDGGYYCRPCWALLTGATGMDAIVASNTGPLSERIRRMTIERGSSQ